MEYTIFGRTGLQVSKLGLGGAPLGGDFEATDEREIERVIHQAIDGGINFIDTAPLYGLGESERRIGKFLGARREKVILSSKAVRSDQRYDYDAVIRSVDDSLSRLRTDWLDLMQLHDVSSQPYELLVEEAIPALQACQQAGKIRFLGVTDRNLDLLQQYIALDVFDSVQFYTRYMLLDHTAKDALLPRAKEHGLGVINGSVLGMGILADRPAHFLEDDVRLEAERKMSQLSFLRRSEPHGLVEPAMRFSFGNPDIHVTLTGVTDRNALAANMACCDGRGLDQELEQRVLSLFQGEQLF